MSKLIQALEDAQLRQNLPEFRAGDTVAVQLHIKEGDRKRIQTFEGVVIARRNRGLNSAFTVRKISFGEGVEKVFPLHSPSIANIKVVRRGDVNKTKLYHLRELSGRAARIKEKLAKRKPVAAAAVAVTAAAPEQTVATSE